MLSIRQLTIIATLALGACSTLSQEECITADWKTIGFEDGSRGYSSQRISAHRESCAEYGVAPDFDRYLVGHSQGLHNYCNYNNGFQLGKSGAGFNAICPEEIAAPFLSGYQQGRKIYDVTNQLTAMEKERQLILEDIHHTSSEIDKKRDMVIAQSTGELLRKELLTQIDVLKDSLARKEADLYSLDRETEKYERVLARLSRQAGVH